MTLPTFLTFFKSFERLCWIAGIILLPLVASAQKKQLYCNKDSVDKWEKDGKVVALINDGTSSYIELKNGKKYEDTTNIPPSFRLKRIGDTIECMIVNIDTIPCAVYIIKGDSGEPICIASFKIIKTSECFSRCLYKDVITDLHYTAGIGVGDGLPRKNFTKYLTWDKQEFTKDIHIIKEKELH